MSMEIMLIDDDIKDILINEINEYPIHSYKRKMKLKNLGKIKFNKSSFMGNVLYLFGLKWIFEYYQKWYGDCTHFGVHLVDIPLNVSRFGFKYTVKLLETNTMDTRINL